MKDMYKEKYNWQIEFKKETVRGVNTGGQTYPKGHMAGSRAAAPSPLSWYQGILLKTSEPLSWKLGGNGLYLHPCKVLQGDYDMF